MKSIKQTYFTVRSIHVFALSLTSSIWALRVADAGYSVTIVSVFAAIVSVVSLLLDIPTGVYADRYGRRRCVLTALFLNACGAGVWAFSVNLYWLIIGCILTGAGTAFFSGALGAWAVDSIRKVSDSEDTTKLFSHGAALSQILAVVAGFLGGTVLIKFGLSWPYKSALCAELVAFVIAYFRMKESWQRQLNTSAKAEVRAMLSGFSALKELLINNVRIRLLVLSSFPVLFAAAAPANLWQIRFQQISPTFSGVTGIVWVFMMGASAVVSFGTPFLVRKSGSPVKFIVVSTVINSFAIASAVYMPVWWSALPLFCIHVAAQTSSDTVRSATTSDAVDEHVRATALSGLSVSFNLADAVGAIFFGWLATAVSMEVSWIVAAILSLVSIPLITPLVRSDRGSYSVE